MGVELVSSIVSILTSGLTSFAGAIGNGLNELATSIFLTTTVEGTTLSVFGGLIVAFAAVALCIGLSRFVVNWLTSFGK